MDGDDGRAAGAIRQPLPTGGYFVLTRDRAEAQDGRFAVTRTSFYALGDGYTAWARFDHNRITLVPENATPTSPATPRAS